MRPGSSPERHGNQVVYGADSDAVAGCGRGLSLGWAVCLMLAVSCSKQSSDSIDAGQVGVGDGGAQGGAPDAARDASPDAASGDAGEGGPVAVTTPLYRSGTRLRANVLTSSSGDTNVIDSFQDTEIDVPCTFRTAADGSLRCLPLTGEAYEPWAGAFADAACSQPALVQLATCAAPARYYLRSTSGCEVRSRVFTVEAAPGSTTAYNLDANGTCTERTLGAGESLHVLTTEVPPSAFVLGEHARTEGTRLVRGLQIGEDGSLNTESPIDLTLGHAACELRLVGDATRCAPFARVYVDSSFYFRDASCKAPLSYAVGRESTCPEPIVGLHMQLDGPYCDGPPITLFEPGARVEGTVYRTGAGGCEATASDAPDVLWSLFEIGEDLPQATLADAHTAELGSKRLRPRVYRGQDEQILGYARDRASALVRFQDTELGVECEPLDEEAGRVLCVPPKASRVVYGDSVCKTKLIELSLIRECKTNAPKVVSQYAAGEYRCDRAGPIRGLEVFELGAAVTPTERYVLDGATCVPDPAVVTNTQYFEVAKELSSAALVTLTRARE